MKIKIKGEMSIPELRQAIYEQLRTLEEQYTVRFSKDVTIYMTPTNGFGEEILCTDMMGREIPVLYSNGPYKSAADSYEIS